MQIYFVKRQEIAPSIWEYYFHAERPVDFVAGQYVEFHLPDVANDPHGPSRTFTLTSVPGDELLSFVFKLPEPHSAYKERLTTLKPGTAARIDDAMGDLVLPKDVNQPLVYIAGGIGMASYASMLKLLLRQREERPIFLFYRLKDRRERIFQDLISAYPLQLNTVIITPNELTAQEITETTPPNALIYLSGSQRFVETLRAGLEQLGTARSQIVFDYFDGYADL